MARKGLLIDTCALIAWVDATDLFHEPTKKYIEQAIADEVPLYVSSLTVAEFSCRQDISDLDPETFILQSFETPEAVLAGAMDAAILRDAGDDRIRLKIDLMLIAHAEKLGVAGIVTGDQNTMAKYCDRLRALKLTEVFPILTSEPFDPARVLNPAAIGMFPTLSAAGTVN